MSTTVNMQYQKHPSPWGNMEMEIGRPSSDIKFQYTDKEYDKETARYNFWHRGYDPIQGRFDTRDRVHLEDDLKNYFGINPYVFTNNNPIRNVDANGNTPAEVVYFIQPHRWAEFPIASSVADEARSMTVEYIRNTRGTNADFAISQKGTYEDNDVDAFRHAFLTIRLRQELGDDAAKNILTNHEKDLFNEQGATKEQHDFDMFNNEVALNVPLDKTVENSKEYAKQLAVNLLNQGKLQTTLISDTVKSK